MMKSKERLAIVSAEGGLFDIIAGQYSRKGINFDLFLKAHCGDSYNADRITRESVYLDSPALTMAFAVQPEVLQSVGRNTQFRGKGFLARFLYTIPKPKRGERRFNPTNYPRHIEDAYDDHIARLLKLPDHEMQFYLSEDAFTIWREFHDEVELLISKGGRLDSLADWGSKLAGAVARIAGLFHMAEYGHDKDKLSGETMAAAAAVGGFFIEHVLGAFGLMQLDPALEVASRIINYVKANRLEKFTARDLMQDIHRFRDRKTVDPGIEFLVERGYIRRIDSPPSSGRGRPRAPVYAVNPKLYDRQNVYNINKNMDETNIVDFVDKFGEVDDVKPA